MLVVAVLAVVFQQEVTSSAKDTAKKNAEPQRLGSVTVVETATHAHRYVAPWSATAMKINTPLRDTPQSIFTITRALIAEQSAQSLADAMRYVPGVMMGQGEGHRDAPTIRGNSSTSDFFADGIRDDAQYIRDLYNVERVEVLGGPNAMIFGRGGGGGVINRVSKRAQWESTRELSGEGGSFAHGRGTLDFGGPLSQTFATRLVGMYEHSGGFRDAASLSRFGVNPSGAVRLGRATLARVSSEYFEDRRTVDRGIPSFAGRPSDAPLAAFFGNPDSSHARAQVTSGDFVLEHQPNDRVTLRTHARLTVYDKFYQNVPPRDMDSTGTRVNLYAYNATMDRANVFGRSELALRYSTLPMPQTLLFGVEVGRQTTDNLRLTGFFNGTAASISVPFDSPTVTTPIEFRPAGSDADNHVVVNVASFYAQDHLRLSSKWEATLGVRLERFDLELRDHRAAQTLARTDDVISPRVGLVFKPAEPLSFYSSYSVSHLPSSGDQFSGLTPSTQALEPEGFANYEVGAKWDVRPELTLTTAAYQLARTNTAAPSALDPGVIVQTGRQKTTGYEISFNGRVAPSWDIVGAFASARAEIVSRTTAAPAGATVPLVPRHTFSLWNRYQLLRTLGLGLGTVSQSAMYAAIDNAVTLPGFWRLDAAAYATGFQNVRIQVNVENLLDRRYHATSHGNNNIMPGAPRTVRVSLTTQIR